MRHVVSSDVAERGVWIAVSDQAYMYVEGLALCGKQSVIAMLDKASVVHVSVLAFILPV